MSAIKPFSADEQAAIQAAYRYDAETGLLHHTRERNGHRGRVKPGDVAGSLAKNGYIMVSVVAAGKKRVVAGHRVAWFLATGFCPGALQIDHIYHNRSNNKLANFRLVDGLANKKNESRRTDNKSGFTGVFWNKRTQRWHASYYVGGKCVSLGQFVEKDAAIEARKAVNEDAGFHQNHGMPRLMEAAHV